MFILAFLLALPWARTAALKLTSRGLAGGQAGMLNMAVMPGGIHETIR
jgi:hypothetical protein